MASSHIKVALVQAGSVLFDQRACLDKVAQYLEKVKDAQLVLFPEAFIPAYPRDLSFGTVVGSRQAAGRKMWQHYWEESVSIPGPATEELGALAKKHAVYLVIGVVERSQAGTGGTLFCSLLYFGPDGRLLHVHRKLKPTGQERVIWGEGDGTDLQVLDTEIGRISGLICWENYMPLARYCLYEQQVQIYLAPTADHRDGWQASMQHIALEGRCFVLSCNQFSTKDDYPAAYRVELEGKDPICSRGGSVIVNPLGQIIAGPLWDQEGILYADLNLDEIIQGKMDFDVSGHYQRPDVFGFQWLKKE